MRDSSLPIQPFISTVRRGLSPATDFLKTPELVILAQFVSVDSKADVDLFWRLVAVRLLLELKHRVDLARLR